MLWVPSAFWLGRAQPGSSTLRPPMVANSLTWRLAWHARSVFPGRADGFASRLRCERCGKNAVALNRLGGCRAPEAAAEGALAFHHKGRPHLLDDIWETDLEDAPRDRLERHIEPKLSAFPELLFSAFEKPEGLRFRGAKAHPAVGPKDLQKPGVSRTGCHAFHFEPHRDLLAFNDSPGVQQGVVPGVARRLAAFAVRPFGVTFLQLSKQASGQPP